MTVFDKPMLATRPYRPPIEDFKRGCEDIWSNGWQTGASCDVEK